MNSITLVPLLKQLNVAVGTKGGIASKRSRILVSSKSKLRITQQQRWHSISSAMHVAQQYNRVRFAEQRYRTIAEVLLLWLREISAVHMIECIPVGITQFTQARSAVYTVI